MFDIRNLVLKGILEILFCLKSMTERKKKGGVEKIGLNLSEKAGPS